MIPAAGPAACEEAFMRRKKTEDSKKNTTTLRPWLVDVVVEGLR
jgi:hypothetical protein